jgi:hypothetical protein
VVLPVREALAAMEAILQPAAPGSEAVPQEALGVAVILLGILARLPVVAVEGLSAT